MKLVGEWVCRGRRGVVAACRQRAADHGDVRARRLDERVGRREQLEVGGRGRVGSAGAELRHPEQVRVRLVPEADVAELRDPRGGSQRRRRRTRPGRAASPACRRRTSRRRRSAGSRSAGRRRRGSEPVELRVVGRPGASVQTELSTITRNPARLASAMFPAGSLHFAASSTPPTTRRRGPPPGRRGSTATRRRRGERARQRAPHLRFIPSQPAGGFRAVRWVDAVRRGQGRAEGAAGGAGRLPVPRRADEVLYVGKAKSLRPRVRQYFQAGRSDNRLGIDTLVERVEPGSRRSSPAPRSRRSTSSRTWSSATGRRSTSGSATTSRSRTSR